MDDKWDIRFMRMAKEYAQFSKDPSTKVGCLLVEPYRRKVIGGYNGFPRYMEDKVEWLTNREEKYARTLHAELNAVLNAAQDLTGWTAYTWPLAPCAHCSLVLIQAGIERVVHPRIQDLMTRNRWEDSQRAGREMLEDCKIIVDTLEYSV